MKITSLLMHNLKSDLILLNVFLNQTYILAVFNDKAANLKFYF